MLSNTITTAKMLFVCVLLALLGAATTYGAWKWQEANLDKAVAAAIEAKDKEIAQERSYTKRWRDMANKLESESHAKKTEVVSVTATATQVIKQERKTNPAFYEQVVPDEGAKQWEAARKLMQ